MAEPRGRGLPAGRLRARRAGRRSRRFRRPDGRVGDDHHGVREPPRRADGARGRERKDHRHELRAAGDRHGRGRPDSLRDEGPRRHGQLLRGAPRGREALRHRDHHAGTLGGDAAAVLVREAAGGGEAGGAADARLRAEGLPSRLLGADRSRAADLAGRHGADADRRRRRRRRAGQDPRPRRQPPDRAVLRRGRHARRPARDPREAASSESSARDQRRRPRLTGAHSGLRVRAQGQRLQQRGLEPRRRRRRGAPGEADAEARGPRRAAPAHARVHRRRAGVRRCADPDGRLRTHRRKHGLQRDRRGGDGVPAGRTARRAPTSATGTRCRGTASSTATRSRRRSTSRSRWT